MFALIITVCATAAMDDCTVRRTGSFQNERQCKVMASIQRDILGPEINYRLSCEKHDEESDNPQSPHIQRGSEAEAMPT